MDVAGLTAHPANCCIVPRPPSELGFSLTFHEKNMYLLFRESLWQDRRSFSIPDYENRFPAEMETCHVQYCAGEKDFISFLLEWQECVDIIRSRS